MYSPILWYSRFCGTVYSCAISTNFHCHLFNLTTPVYMLKFELYYFAHNPIDQDSTRIKPVISKHSQFISIYSLLLVK